MSNPNSIWPSPQPFDLSINVSVDVMNLILQQFFGNIPNAFQQQIIPNILMMMKGRIQSQPILLVQSTGGGKSAVPQACGSTVPGVTIVIENTLALCADQVSKFDKVEAEGSHIFTIQLDHFKSRSKQQYVIDKINLFIDRSNTNQPLNASIFIFASPERLVSDE